MEAIASRQPVAQPIQTDGRPVTMDLEQIFREYNGLVFRTAYRITGSNQDAEDVLQTVFLRLARKEEDAEYTHLPSYLRRAAINAAFDLLRGRQRARATPLDDVAPALIDRAAHSPDLLYQDLEIKQWLRNTVAQLSPMAAQIFALRFFEGKDNPEIAEIVGASLGTVSVTLSRARDRVEREFQIWSRKQ